MKREQKLLMSLLVVFSAVGVILIVLLAIFGVGQKGTALSRGCSWAADILAIIALIAHIVGLHTVRKGIKCFGEPRYTVTILKKWRYKAAFIFLCAILAVSFIILFTIADLTFLPTMIMLVALPSMFIVRNSLINSINENGVFYWGSFFGWKKISSFKLDDTGNGPVLMLSLISGYSGLETENEVQLVVRPEDKEAILCLVRESPTRKEGEA